MEDWLYWCGSSEQIASADCCSLLTYVVSARWKRTLISWAHFLHHWLLIQTSTKGQNYLAWVAHNLWRCLSSYKAPITKSEKDIVYPLSNIDSRSPPEWLQILRSRYSQCSELGGKEVFTVCRFRIFWLENKLFLIQDAWYLSYALLNPVDMVYRLI